MYSVDQALELLDKKGITNSIQMLRRWLRAGKIAGASQKSRKTGWEIPIDSLNAFIELKEKEPRNVTGTVTKERLDQAYQKGYQSAVEDVKKRDLELLEKRGVSERSFYIYRSDVFELGQRLVNPQLRKDFKKYLDDVLFKKYVKNSRQRLEVFQLGDWCMVWESKDILDRSKFEEAILAFEDRFVDALLDKYLKKFLKQKATK